VVEQTNSANRGTHDRQAALTRGRILTSVAITGLAVFSGISHLIWPSVHIDGTLVALAVVAALPWLGSIMDSLSLPGGWTIKYREIQRATEQAKEHANEAKAAAASAEQRAAFAAAASDDERRSGIRLFEAMEEPAGLSEHAKLRVAEGTPPEEEDPGQRLAQLVDAYERIRQENRPGPWRTRQMTDIVAKMTKVSPLLPDFDWHSALSSEGQGQRLSGYAYLYARPVGEGAMALVDALLRGDKPFGEYWGLRALQQCVDRAEPTTAARIVPLLQQLNFPAGTDRAYELQQTLEQIQRERSQVGD
jgi:hypothetical protein